MSAVNFLGGLLNGFAQGRQQQELLKENKEVQKAKVKLYEMELKKQEREAQQAQKQEESRAAVMARLQGQQMLPGSGIVLEDPRGAPGLTDLLADPEMLSQMIAGGMMTPQAALEMQQKQKQQAFVASLLGGGQAPGDMPQPSTMLASNGPVPMGSGGAPSPFEVSGVKLDSTGNPMLDFTRRGEIAVWKVSGDGRTEVGLDKMGRTVATRPAAPSARAPEDVPLTPGDLSRFPEATPGMTLNDVRRAGMKPQDPDVAPEVAGRISGLVQAKEIADNVQTAFLKPDGKIDEGLVISAFANFPNSRGRNIRNDILIGADAVLRARTGAGVNVKEQDDVVKQFLPSPLDDDAGKRLKLKRFQQFIDGTLDIATLPPSVRKRLQEAEKKGGKVAASGKSGEVDFGALPK